VTSENVAALDIGTNSVRLLITDGEGRELDRSMRITRLGQGVDVSGVLHPAAIARTVEVFTEYGARIRSAGVARMRAVATSAVRDAANSETFFAAATQALGFRPELASGEEEARLSFAGATAGLSRELGPFLVIDIGGGSTEFVLGSSEPEALISVQLGCVRLTERRLKSDPPTGEELEACFADVRAELSRVREVIDVARARRVIGLAGTVTALSAMVLGLEHYDAQRTHHSVLRRDDVEALFARLSAASVETRRTLLVQPERAEVIVGGAAVLVTILRELCIDELVVSERDILDGLAASLRPVSE
jgi:exopolyphosphatase/guanosine-5'-triphosphate,3'-diphosphate pyrophosphatase